MSATASAVGDGVNRSGQRRGAARSMCALPANKLMVGSAEGEFRAPGSGCSLSPEKSGGFSVANPHYPMRCRYPPHGLPLLRSLPGTLLASVAIYPIPRDTFILIDSAIRIDSEVEKLRTSTD
jgi:hypothetical protein